MNDDIPKAQSSADRDRDGIRKIVEYENRLRQNADKPGGFGRNGGVPCDTFSGPCNCGAWH